MRAVVEAVLAALGGVIAGYLLYLAVMALTG